MSLGVGAMLSYLGGNKDTVEAHNTSLNKVINKVVIDDSELTLQFTDNTSLRFFDDGQSCCESRYMRTDDEIDSIIGGVFLGAEIKQAPEIEDEYGSHEVEFLEIKTSIGSIVISNHNEHNGYYGGFAIVCRIEKPSN